MKHLYGTALHSTVVLLLTLASTANGQRIPSCGNEGQHACDPGDTEFWTNGSTLCDWDLVPHPHGFSASTCNNLTRWTQSRAGGWLGWAMAQQRYGIGADTPINWVQHFGTHNSFSNYAQQFKNPLNVNQYYSITDQLQLGARFIRLDPHWYFSQLRLCHAEANTGKGSSCDGPSVSTGRLFGFGLREVANWMESNPDEVLILTMNDYVEGHDSHVNDPIKSYMGDKVYTPAMKPDDRWPTIQELHDSGKRIIIFSDDAQGETWIFKKGTWNYSTLYPTNDQFNGCKDENGDTILDHSLVKWLTITEGRTGSDEIAGHKFLLDESEVKKAAACGYSNIGVDFLMKLDAAWPKYKRSTEDRRREASIWSFEEDDMGERGPSVMRASTGRWYSHRATNLHHFVCSDGGTVRDKKWQVTNAVGTYYDPSATSDPCRTEFGADWRFDYPSTGRQNDDLRIAARGRDAWMKYSVKPVPDVAAAPPYLTFNHTRAAPPSGDLPDVKVYGFKPGTPFLAAVKHQAFNGVAPRPWLSVKTRGPFGTDIIDAGGTSLKLSILDSVSTFQVGGYDASVTLTYPTGTANVNVHLEVKEPTTISLTPQYPTVNDGQSPIVFYADVAGRRLPDFQDYITGQVVLKALVFDENGRVVDTRDLASGVVNSFDGGSLQDGRAVLSSFNLEGGNYKLVATYLGDGHYAAKSTGPIDYLVQPFVTVNKPYVRFTAKYNSTSPDPPGRLQTNVPVNFTMNFNNNENFLNLRKIDGSNADLSVGSVFNLAVGTHTALVYGTSAVNGRHSETKVELDIQSFLFGNVQTLNFDSGNDAKTALVSLSSIYGPMQVTLQTTTSDGGDWLKLTAATLTTPGNFLVAVNPAGLPAGHYSGAIVANSRHALVPWTIQVNLTVFPAITINTNVGALPFKTGASPMNAPATMTWPTNSTQTLTFDKVITVPGQARYTFLKWSDGVLSNTRGITVTSPATYTALFAAEYVLNAGPAPAAGGDILLTPVAYGAFYPAGATVQVTAKAKPAWQFTSFFGALQGASPTGSVVMSGPQSLTATFRNTATAPILYASSAAARTDGPAVGMRKVPLEINNNGMAAQNVQITGVTDIAVLVGSGAVSLAQVTPTNLGAIDPGQPKTATLLFNWPATANRIRFTVQLRANNGAYIASTTLNLNR